MSSAPLDPELRAFAEAARGFMPPEEGLALHAAARAVEADGPFLEVGSYCGKSAVYIGAAAAARGRVLFALDHHRGSEENQAGWEWHEPDLVDPEIGVMDTLPIFRRTVHDAGLEGTVVALVGDSPTVGAVWATPLALLFIDGGHGHDPAHRDYEIWVPHVVVGGRLLIHDVFPDPADGGRPPYEIYCRAMESGAFRELEAVGSLRVLERTGEGI
jgi:predicted O-methyltransferase YrrM